MSKSKNKKNKNKKAMPRKTKMAELTPVSKQTNNRPSATNSEIEVVQLNDQMPPFIPRGVEYTVVEIAEDGNLEAFVFMPNICSSEIYNLKNYAPNLYFYEKQGKSCLLFHTGCAISEAPINPSYYADDRYSKLKQKEEVFLTCYLYDSASQKLVSVQTYSLYGKVLEYVKKSLEMNAQFDRRTYESWLTNVLWAYTNEYNIRNSILVGYCEKCLEIEHSIPYIRSA